MLLKRVTARQESPISAAEVNQFLNIGDCNGEDGDSLIESFIDAALDYVEKETGRLIGEQTWDLWLDQWPSKSKPEMWWDGARELPLTELQGTVRHIDIPKPPLIEVEFLKTHNINNDEATVDDDIYHVDTAEEYSRLSLQFGRVWPTVILRPAQGVQLRFKAGYSVLPAPLKTAALMIAANLFESRGVTNEPIPNAAFSLMSGYKIARL